MDYNDNRNILRKEEGTAVQDFLHRTWAEVHLDRLEANVGKIREMLKPGCRIMGIVKADAYGHGAVACARALCRAGVEYLGVSNLEEAIQLRRAGIAQPILVISYTPSSEAVRLAAYNVTQTVLSLPYAEELNRAAVSAGVRLKVHIKLDTGMSRVGFVCHREDEVAPTAAQVLAACRLPALEPEGIFTHFASADEEDDGGFTRKQFSLFTAVTDAVEAGGVHFALRHCCNSAATVRFPEMHLDMVRPGIILYGLAPDTWMQGTLAGFRSVMELKTMVSMVKDLPLGNTVSYNRTYTTQSLRRVATLPIGYADGYSRALSNRAEMLIHGRRVPVIGRVCMDQCMVDVTDVPDVGEGSTLTVFGEDDGELLSVNELAALAGTINYEIVCLLSKRVPRLFFSGDTMVDQLNYIIPD